MPWRLVLALLLLPAFAGAAGADLGKEIASARKLAHSERRDSLPRLLNSYRAPAPPREQVREQIAPLIAFAFGRGEYARTFLEAFARDLGAPEHAWLAYQVFGEWMKQRRGDRVRLGIAALKGHPFHRAAGLRALAQRPTDADRSVARRILTTLPTDALGRAVLTEAAAELLLADWKPGEDLERDPTFVLLVTRFDDPLMHDRTRLAVGRMLAKALESQAVYLTADAWRGFAERRRAREQLVREGYYPGSTSVPTFMGIAAAGRDICYVLDISGSMSTRLRGAPTGRRGGGQTRRRAPVTGRKRPLSSPPRDGGNGNTDLLQGIENLPWSKIHTRLDLVCEALKASLRSLEKHQRFAVILFDDGARPLSFTRKPQLATEANVSKACKRLDALTATGSTNLHHGLELAFGMTREGLSMSNTFVGEDHILDGLDTIFVLTDGHPNRDNYSTQTSGGTGQAFFQRGVFYATTAHILTSVERMNLFRRAEIHCIGMGSSPRSLLQGLAELGGGKAKFLGY